MLSIVMAYHNRYNLLLNTLSSIQTSILQDKEVIIIDDGSNKEESILNLDVSKYNFEIKTLYIDPSYKWYHNPCIPFNIGIYMASGEKIVLQNPECYHLGDVCSAIDSLIEPNKYISCHCYSLSKEETNIVKNFTPDNIINKPALHDGDSGWYNHNIYRPVGYHFLSGITKQDLFDIGMFNINYAYGIGYDDNEFLLRIKHNIKDFIYLSSPFVLHQYHYNNIYSKEQAEINAILSERNRSQFHKDRLKYIS